MPLWEPGAPKQPRSLEKIEEDLSVNALMELDPTRALELVIEYVRRFGTVIPVDIGERIQKFGINIQTAAARVTNNPALFPDARTAAPLINDMLMLGKNLEILGEGTKPDEHDAIEPVLVMMLSNYNNRF